MNGLPWLSWLVFFPLLAAVGIALLPATATRAIRAWAVTAAFAEAIFSLPLWWRLQPASPGWQFEERRAWLPALGAR